MPNANPKKSPDIMPTFPGNNSCAYTRIAEKAEARMTPIGTVKTAVQKRFACGSSKVNGATPRIENQITYFLPKRSPNGPPSKVPDATENVNMKRKICAC